MQKLTVHVVKAILTRNLQIIRKMDPYVELNIKQHKGRSQVFKQGDMPDWNQTFQFILSTGNWAHVLNIQVKDQNGLGDQLVGEVTIQINPSNLQATNGQKWYSLKYEKRPAGKIMLNINCAPYHLGYDNILVSPTIKNNIKIQPYDMSPFHNSDSNFIRLHQSSQNSESRKLSQLKMEKINSNFTSTNQTFYTGRRGIQKAGYSVEKMNFIPYNQSSGIKISQVPAYIKMNQASNIRI